MLTYIRTNKEWIFSGVGVAIVLGAVTFFSGLFRHEHQPSPRDQTPPNAVTQQAAPQPSATQAYSTSKLTPESIMKELEAARPLQRPAIAKTFVGVPVEWDLSFSDATVRETDASLIFYSPGDRGLHPGVVCNVSAKRAAELRFLERGTLVHIRGKIRKIEYIIYLSDAVITPK